MKNKLNTKKKYTTEFLIQLVTSFSILLGLFHLSNCIIKQSITYDEYNHYSFSEELLSKKIAPERVSGHISTTPVIILNVLSHEFFSDSRIVNYISNKFSVTSEWWPKRLPGIFWYLFLILGSFKISRLLFGWYLPYLVVVSVSLSPTLISHASVVTVDLPYAASVIWLSYYMVLNMKSLSLARIILASFFLGLSLVIKFTGLLLVPIFVISILLSVFKNSKVNNYFFKSLIFILSLAISVYITCLIVNFSYLFFDIKYWTTDFIVSSKILVNTLTILPSTYLPLSQSFISGIDECLKAERGGTWNVILWDQFLTKGSVWYFPMNFLYKTQLSVILLTIIGFFISLYKGTAFRHIILFLQLVLGAYYFCFIFQTQVGFRYVLFLAPLLYLISYSGYFSYSSKFYLLSTTIILFESLFGFYKFTGYLLSYYNPVFVDSKKPYLYVTDSNFDWGHTNELFWNKERVEGPVDNEILQPGYNTFSSNRLAGVLWDFPKRAWIRRNLTPVKTLAQTFFVFNVSDQEFKDYLEDQRTFFEEKKGKEFCENNKEYLVKNTKDNKEVLFQTKGGKYCVNTPDNTILYITAKDKAGNNLKTTTVGIMQMSGECHYDEIHDDQKAWFRLLRGYHVICLKEEADYFLNIKE